MHRPYADRLRLDDGDFLGTHGASVGTAPVSAKAQAGKCAKMRVHDEQSSARTKLKLRSKQRMHTTVKWCRQTRTFKASGQLPRRTLPPRELGSHQ